MEELTEALDSNEDIDIIYLDFKKAFDRVPHKRLKKLWGYGIRGKVHSWIKEFLSGKRQKVVINGKISKQQKLLAVFRRGASLDLHYS